MAVQQAVALPQNLDPVDSDGGSDVHLQMEEDRDASGAELEPEPEPGCDPVPPAETQRAPPLLKGVRTGPRDRGGPGWEGPAVGGAHAHVGLPETAGPTRRAKARLASRLGGFLSLVDPVMLTPIRNCSVTEDQHRLLQARARHQHAGPGRDRRSCVASTRG